MNKTKVTLVHTDTLSCEAICRIAPNGELIIISQCGGTKEPDPDNRVYAFHSTDQGQSWTKTTSVYPENGRAVYCTEVYVSNNKIYAFLTLHNGRFLDFDQVIMESADSGHTWVESPVHFNLEGFVFIRGIIELANGKRMIPYQQYLVSNQENERLNRESKYIWHANIDEVNNGIIVTDQSFDSIEKRGIVNIPLTLDGKRVWQWTEPTLAQLSDQSIVMLLRVNHTGRLFRSDSSDLGHTWSRPRKTTIKNPGNKPKLIKLNDHRIALLNTFNDGRTYRDRNPLSVWISEDDLKTFAYKRTLVSFPGYLSYPDGCVSADGRKIQFAFEFNRHDIYYVEHVIE